MVRDESQQTSGRSSKAKHVSAARAIPAQQANPLEHVRRPGDLTDVGGGSAGTTLPLQRLAGNAAVAQLLASQQADEAISAEPKRSPVLDVVGRGGGSPLDSDVRRTMEASFGHDFSAVRIHTGPAAAASAASIQAIAYTFGNDIVMPRGVDRTSHASLHTLAHELTHVTQQRSGPVDGTPAPGGIKVSDPSDRFEQEAERTAIQVVRGFALNQ